MYKGTQSLEYLFYCEMFTLRWNNGQLLQSTAQLLSVRTHKRRIVQAKYYQVRYLRIFR